MTKGLTPNIYMFCGVSLNNLSFEVFVCVFGLGPFQCQEFWNAAAPGASCFSDSGTVTIFKHPNFLISEQIFVVFVVVVVAIVVVVFFLFFFFFFFPFFCFLFFCFLAKKVKWFPYTSV